MDKRITIIIWAKIYPSKAYRYYQGEIKNI